MQKNISNISESIDFPEKIEINEIARKMMKNRFYTQELVENQLALITHYLHNKGKAEEKVYKKSAIKEIETVIHTFYPEATPSSIAAAIKHNLFTNSLDIPFSTPAQTRFTFIDLFAGMGGFRIAMQAQGGRCVFSSEWNKYAQKTYFANFGEYPFGDITKEETKKYIPANFDILCAGFPCQPFSLAGVSKKKSLGRETGFLDKAQGTLFFDVAEIIRDKRPKAFFLENVKNLVSHDKGKTFKVIEGALKELGYSLHYKIIDGKGYVPQHRERIMIIGFDKEHFEEKENFNFPTPPAENNTSLVEILQTDVSEKYTLSDKLWSYLRSYAEKHKSIGNGFGYGLADINGTSRTLSARYYKDGAEILIPQPNQNPRRLTPRECARLMGYTDDFIIDAVSEVQCYRQCGNSVVVPLITAVSKQLVETMLNFKKND